jgi:Pyridine nucleotide-disulphide oxidoreductase
VDRFDVIIIGMGPGGEAAAGRLLEAGRQVAVVERELIGGECAYWACVPSKTLLRGPEAKAAAGRVAGVATPGLDWAALRGYRDYMIRHLDDAEQVRGYEQAGGTVVKGTARLAGPGRVEAGGRLLEAGHIVIATGSQPVRPPVDGLEGVTVWTNREATTVRDIPRRVLLVGGSAVGVRDRRRRSHRRAGPAPRHRHRRRPDRPGRCDHPAMDLRAGPPRGPRAAGRPRPPGPGRRLGSCPAGQRMDSPGRPGHPRPDPRRRAARPGGPVSHLQRGLPHGAGAARPVGRRAAPQPGMPHPHAGAPRLLPDRQSPAGRVTPVLGRPGAVIAEPPQHGVMGSCRQAVALACCAATRSRPAAAVAPAAAAGSGWWRNCRW